MVTAGLRKFNVYDKTGGGRILVGTHQVRDGHNETAEEAAHRRAAAQLGHENYEIEEVAPETQIQRVARLMTNYFKDHAQDW